MNKEAPNFISDELYKTDPQACYSESVVEVESRSVSMSVSSSAEEYCSDEGEVYGYVNVDDYTSRWEPVGGSAEFETSTANNSKVTNLQDGINVLRWTVTTVMDDVKCESYKDIKVVNNKPPKAIVRETQTSCDTYANILGNIPPQGTYGEWSIADGEGYFDNSTAYSTKVYGLTADDVNFVKWTIHKGSCTSSAQIAITVNKMITNTSGDNGTDTLQICGTSSPISAAPAGEDAEGWWTTASKVLKIENSTSENASVSGVTTGAHTLVWHVRKTDGSECSASARLIVVNNQYKTTANLATPNPVCDGYATLIGNVPTGGATGWWTYPSTAKVSDSNQPVTTLYPTVNGVNTAYWHIKKGRCETIASVEVQNYSVTATLGEDLIACKDDDVRTIAAPEPPAGGYGYWENPNGHVKIENSDAFITTVTDIQQGANTLVWHVYSAEVPTSDGGVKRCHAQDELVVNNNHFVTNAGRDFPICQTWTEVNALYQGPDARGYWSGSGTFEESTNNRTIVTGLPPASDNVLRWTVEMNGCTAYDEITVTNNQVEITITSGDKSVCTPSTNLEAHQSAGTGVWDVVKGHGTIPANLRTTQASMVNELAPGPNTIRWTVTNGDNNCKTFKEVVITNNAINITAGYDQSTCDTFAILAGQPLTSTQIGTWTWGASSDNPLSTNANFDHPEFVDEHLYNTKVTGLYYNDDGYGYSNVFTWSVKDTATNCSAEASVRVTSYHFLVDADVTSIENEHTVDKSNECDVEAKLMDTYTGSWKVVGGTGKFDDSTQPKTHVTGLAQGVNLLQWTATLVDNEPDGVRRIPQCKASDVVQINYNAFNVEAGQSKSICVDTIKLNAEKVEKAVSYWTSGQRGAAKFDDSTDPKTIVRGLARGVNVLWWNVTKNGFTARDSVVIYNYSFDVDAGKDQHLCEDYTQLKASKPYGNSLINPDNADTISLKGYWDTPIGGVHYYDAKQRDTKIDSLHAMTNVLVWHSDVTIEKLWTTERSTLTCYAQDTVKVTYYVAPKPNFKTIPGTASGCSPLEMQFVNKTVVPAETQPNVSYVWRYGDLKAETTVDHDSIRNWTFTNDKEYDSTVTVWLTTYLNIPGDVCSSSDSSDVIIFGVPRAKISTDWPGNVIQQSKNMSINASTPMVRVDGTSYAWDFGDGSEGDFWQDNTQYREFSNHPYKTYGEFKVSVLVQTKHGCPATDTVTVTILPAPPALTISPKDEQKCGPNVLHRFEEGVDYADTIRWDIYYAVDSTKLMAQLFTPHGQTAEFLFTEVGRYIMREYAYGPGTDHPVLMRTDKLIITQTPTAEFSIHPDTVRLPNVPLFTHNESKYGATYIWDFGDNTPTSGEMDPVHYYTEEGDYYVTLKVISKDNCPAISPQKHVRVEAEGLMRFPTAFRPDPSGPCGGIETKFENFVFLPYPRRGVKAGTYMLEIFNRYGEKIYESTDPNIGWDGYYRGELCKQDVYVFKCRCTFENGKLFKQIGNVTLLR
jgi:PKD repeat protein